MRLHLELPEGLLAALDADLWIAPLAPAPADPDAELEALLCRAAPAEVSVTRCEQGTTAAGWPYRLVAGSVSGAADERLAVLFHFLEYAGLILLRSRAPLAAAGDAVERALATARPDWSGQVVSLRDAWAGFEGAS